MKRIELSALAVCLAAPAALAQSELRPRMQPVEAPIRHGGTYHVAQGTWTHNGPSLAALVGPDVIYDNTCTTGYFAGIGPTDLYTEEGLLPSPSTPDTSTTKPGCAAAYLVNGFQIGYCTVDTAVTVGASFIESYEPCDGLGSYPTAASFLLTGLPSTPTTGVQSCWLIQIDLTGTPNRTFAIASDGGTAGGPPTFGYTLSMPLAVGNASNGFLIAGNPTVCGPWDGTIWDPVVNLAEDGTGMGNLDQFRIDGGTGNPPPGCYFFGGSPFAGFHLELYADAACAPAPGTDFCLGNGSGTACPCGNNSVPSRPTGCSNSFGVGASLDSLGIASVTNDTLVLRASDLPLNTVALFSQGTAQANGGAGTVVGDGLGCLSGTIVRLGTASGENGGGFLPQPSATRISVLGGIPAGGGVTRHYQVTYRDVPAFCTTAEVNLTNGHTIVWGP